MKSSKIWKYVWLIGIYANLFIILYLVVLYKVQWEYKDLNTYLYFYDCDRELCTSNVSVDNYYNKILCNEGKCPYIDTIIGNNVILRDNGKSFIYDYTKGNIVNNLYSDYRYIGNGAYSVRDGVSKYGVINTDGEILVNFEYNYIDDFQDGFVSYIDNNLYGISGVDNKFNVEPKFEDVVLINENIYAGKIDNLYQIYSYGNDNGYATNYNYVFADKDVILVIDDAKIDILDSKLQSTLLMKIDTYYKYTTGQERDSLDIYSDGEYIYFKVFVNDSEYNRYRYNIDEKKLIND